MFKAVYKKHMNGVLPGSPSFGNKRVEVWMCKSGELGCSCAACLRNNPERFTKIIINLPPVTQDVGSHMGAPCGGRAKVVQPA